MPHFLRQPPAAPGRPRRATPGRDVTAPGSRPGGRVVSPHAARREGRGERGILARFASSRAPLPTPSRPLPGSPPQCLASSSGTAGIVGEARGGPQARRALRVGASGLDEPAGPTPSREPPSVGKPLSGRAGARGRALQPPQLRRRPGVRSSRRLFLTGRAGGTVRGAPRADGGTSSPRLSSGGARAGRRARLLPPERRREQLEEEQRRRASPRGGPQHG